MEPRRKRQQILPEWTSQEIGVSESNGLCPSNPTIVLNCDNWLLVSHGRRNIVSGNYYVTMSLKGIKGTLKHWTPGTFDTKTNDDTARF